MGKSVLLTGGVSRGADLRPALTRRSASCRAQHTMDHIVALCAPLFRTQPPQATPPGAPPNGQLPCPLAVGCISNTPSQPAVSGSGSASSSCFCILFPCAQVCSLCAPSVSYISSVSCVLVCPVVCFPSSSVQCASVPVLIRVACCLGLASALGLFWVLPRSLAGAVAAQSG